MTEEEYTDLTNLTYMEAAISQLRMVDAFHDPNKTRMAGIKCNLSLCIENIRDKYKEKGFIGD